MLREIARLESEIPWFCSVSSLHNVFFSLQLCCNTFTRRHRKMWRKKQHWESLCIYLWDFLELYNNEIIKFELMKNACIAWAMASLLHQTWKCSEKEPKIKESHTRKRVGVGRELNDNLWYFNYKKDNWKSEWKKFCGRFFSAFLYLYSWWM